jgi:hypothetical protein
VGYVSPEPAVEVATAAEIPHNGVGTCGWEVDGLPIVDDEGGDFFCR